MSRIAILNRSKCFPKRCSQECSKYCPVNRMGKECIVIKDVAHIDEVLCTGCGICPKKCPFGAIQIVNLPEALKEAPVFRYAENAFELFRLPIPIENQVVGIVGANGIGKSTALEVLSGIHKPNLGEYDNPLDERAVIEHFKGTELHKYFSNLFKQKATVSYKPQYVDMIPKKFDGTVIELLRKHANEEQIKTMAKKLNILHILSRHVHELSGGELQKTAISAAVLKEADLYFFDEPASYLDVKERVRIAKVIRELSESGKQVLVVEHDLIILDFLADLVHILFGQTAAYGVVSHPLSAKNGINTYLDGYIRGENIRFRPEPLKFEHHMITKESEALPLVSWPEMYKEMKSGFKLNIDSSELHYKEVVGIVGANATGKTTFMRMLVGELTPDKGKLDSKLKISYKPQYIKGDSILTVKLALLEANKMALTQENVLNILRPLKLEHLMEHIVRDLSGGELQRVAVAICLLRDADVYLLDEPSTYLDVEQRLQVAKAIQKVIKHKDAAALVIDHDLLFVSFISDRVMVFDGEPSKAGHAKEILPVKEGMNSFLKELDITLRKDPETNRPRVNKPGSQKDAKQRKSGEFYQS